MIYTEKMTAINPIDINEAVDVMVDKWAKTERSYYLTTIILIAVVAVALWFYSIYSIRQTTKDFTEDLAEQRKEFLNTMEKQNALFTEAIYDIKIGKYTK